LDSLLDHAPQADHSAVAALERILIQQQLLASRKTNRGGNAVVCWTEVPLLQLPSLRQFRPHRMRWDFESFGLCISKTWLAEQGARPVRYGDESTWTQLADSERPYFQLNHPADKRTPESIDWSMEQEWRNVGDLDLRDLPADQGFVFVPDAESASRIARVSRWPITLWPSPAQPE
jgi:hypothetical protein